MTRAQRSAALAIGLFAAALVTYAPVRQHAFLSYDDMLFVTDNPIVQRGLTLEGVLVAATRTDTGSWHPITWLSHMIDVEWFGLDAGAHHMVNALLHALAAALLFLALQSLVGQAWPAAFAAGLFALHPQNVESVAWIAERRDVLSAIALAATLGGWARYARAPSRGRLAWVVLAHAAGLMTKPMLVSVPLLLLVLDGWPLRRLGRGQIAARLREKAPLFALSLACAAITLWVQRGGGAVASLEALPLSMRAANAAVSTLAYLEHFAWPRDLAVLYPYPPGGPATGRVVFAVACLIVLSGAAFAARRRAPYLMAGWLWYLVALIPVIGVVQVGRQAMADRYTYLPMLGIELALAMAAASLVSARPRVRFVVAGLAGLALAGCAVATRAQLAHWRNDETLFGHTLRVTQHNGIAALLYANALEGQGRDAERLALYGVALELEPRNSRVHYNLARLLAERGDPRGAERHYRLALELEPLPQAHTNLANLLAADGRSADAERHYRAALELAPGHASALFDLALLDAARGRLAAAEEGLAAYRAVAPADLRAPARIAGEMRRRGLELWAAGAQAEAARHLARAHALAPGAELANELAWVRATAEDASLRDGEAAVALARRALEAGETASRLDTLAAAHAESGRYGLALSTAERALAKARELDERALEQAIGRRIESYVDERAWRDRAQQPR